jgi:hypothetical protein
MLGIVLTTTTGSPLAFNAGVERHCGPLKKELDDALSLLHPRIRKFVVNSIHTSNHTHPFASLL